MIFVMVWGWIPKIARKKTPAGAVLARDYVHSHIADRAPCGPRASKK